MFASFEELTSKLTEKFAEFQGTFHTAFTEYKRQLPCLLSAMISESWYPDFDMPIIEMRSLEPAARIGDTALIDTYLIRYFQRAACDIESRLIEHYPARAHVMSVAFQAYREQRYVLCIPVFLAQADGISEELLSKHFFTPKKSVPAAQRLVQNDGLSDYEQILLDPLLQSGTIREHTQNLLGRMDYLNRHTVLHGIDLNYGTEKNALKAISLLAYMSSIRINNAL